MNKISSILIIALIVTIAGCSPKFDPAIKKKFDDVAAAMQTAENNSEASALQAKFPEFNFTGGNAVKDKVENGMVINSAFDLKDGEVSDIIKLPDGSCGIVKRIKGETQEMLRVSYIYLENMTEEGGNIADQIIAEFEAGTSFGDLAYKYSKDGNATTGGDMTWVAKSKLDPQFAEAITSHSVNEIYKVKTDKLGWYVIMNTHAPETRTTVNTISAIYKDCYEVAS